MTNEIRDKMAEEYARSPDSHKCPDDCYGDPFLGDCAVCNCAVHFKHGFDSGAAHQKKVDEERIKIAIEALTTIAQVRFHLPPGTEERVAIEALKALGAAKERG